MAKQRIVKIICDNCKSVGDPDWESGHGSHSKPPLPIGWVTISIASEEGHMFDGDLCDKCVTVIFNAIKKRFKES